MDSISINEVMYLLTVLAAAAAIAGYRQNYAQCVREREAEATRCGVGCASCHGSRHNSRK